MVPPSTVTHLGHIVVVLRRSPTPITSSPPSSRRRADETLPRPQLDQEIKRRHRAERGGVVHSVLGSVGSRRCSTTSTTFLNTFAFGLRGYVDTLSPLISMHLLDRSCVIVGKFFEILRSPSPPYCCHSSSSDRPHLHLCAIVAGLCHHHRESPTPLPL